MIKLFEQYKMEYQIMNWLDDMGIGLRNYNINDDLTVDVDGDVNIWSKGLIDVIPIQFGKVTGNFDCRYNKLSSLKGFPKYVGGRFSCVGNYITSLEYAPKYFGSISLDNNPLPDEVLSFIDLHTLIKHQDDYAIWNTDGSFNKGRFDIFYKDFHAGILD